SLGTCSGGFRLLIHYCLGELGERLVGSLLLVQCLLQQGGCLVEAELFGPRTQRAVPRDLIVLDRLRGGQQAGIERRLALVLVHDLRAFVSNADDRCRTCPAASCRSSRRPVPGARPDPPSRRDASRKRLSAHHSERPSPSWEGC